MTENDKFVIEYLKHYHIKVNVWQVHSVILNMGLVGGYCFPNSNRFISYKLYNYRRKISKISKISNEIYIHFLYHQLLYQEGLGYS